ncbi:MAG: hypothetical protein R3Y06_09130 [Faecalibacterium sp.]
MKIREIPLWQRMLAMLCALSMLAMLFPFGIFDAFAEEEKTITVTLGADTLYAQPSDEQSNKTTITISDVFTDEEDAAACTKTEYSNIVTNWNASESTLATIDTSAGTTTLTAKDTATTGGEVTITVTKSATKTVTDYTDSTLNVVGEGRAPVVTEETATGSTTVTVWATPELNVSVANVNYGTELVATVTGTSKTPNYQWYKADGTIIADETDDTYNADTTGEYYVVVTLEKDDTSYTTAATATSNTAEVSAWASYEFTFENETANTGEESWPDGDTNDSNNVAKTITYGDEIVMTWVATAYGSTFTDTYQSGLTTDSTSPSGFSGDSSSIDIDNDINGDTITATVTILSTKVPTDGSLYVSTSFSAGFEDGGKIHRNQGADTINIDPYKLTFDVTVDGKNYDGTTDVEGTVSALLADGSSLIAADNTATASVGKLVGDNFIALTAEDFEFESAGDVAEDKSVSVTLKSTVTPVVALTAQGDDAAEYTLNYSAAVTVNNATIAATTAAGGSYIAPENATDGSDGAPDYEVTDSSGITYWYQGGTTGTVPVSAGSYYQISATADDETAGTEYDFSDSANIMPSADGTLTFYVKNNVASSTTYGDIAKVTLGGGNSNTLYKVDSVAPTIGYSTIGDSLLFDDEAVTYNITVTDTGSGVDDTTVQYYILTRSTEQFGGTWVDTDTGDNAYTFTVSVPSNGYLYIIATDNVGNTYTTDSIRPLVLENTAPTVSVTDATATTYAQEHTISVTAKDAAEEGTDPYAYSGIDTVTYSVALGEYDNTTFGAATKKIENQSLINKDTPTEMLQIPGNREESASITIGSDTVPDLAGYTGAVTVAVTATDFCGNSTTKYITVYIDTVAPTASISMSGGNAYDSTYYYNADNGGITVTFADENNASLFDGTYTVTLTTDGTADGDKVTALDSKSATVASGDTSATVTFTAADVATLADGTITITVEATDNAGNTTTQLNTLTESTLTPSEGVVISGLTATFIMDKTAPVVTEIKTDKTSGGNYDGTYYYNDSAVTTIMTIQDTNLDATRVSADMTVDPTNTNSDAEVGTVGDEDTTLDITFTMSGEGTYSNFTVTATDKAGNPLILTSDNTYTADGAADKATDDSSEADPVGKVTLTNSKIIDTTAPTATIVYTSAATPNMYAEDNKTETANGTAYYNKTTTATITFNDENPLDYTRLTAEQAGEVEADGTLSGSTYDKDTSATFTVSTDGTYTFAAFGTDLAGNALIVTEYVPGAADDTGAVTTEGCETEYTAYYTIAVDTTAPTYVFEIDPVETVAEKDLQTVDGTTRYYFNGNYTATAEIFDTNFDAARTTVAVAAATSVSGNSAAYDEFKDTDYKALTESSVAQTYTETVQADGIYRYQIYGSDKAGNALVPSTAQVANILETTMPVTAGEAAGEATDEEVLAELSYYIVRDTAAPTGALNIANGTDATAEGYENYYTIDTNGNVTVAAPYRSETDAYLTFTVDSSELSPVIMVYTINQLLVNATAWTADSVSEKDFEYGKIVLDSVTGEQIFTVTDYVITDLAGNTSADGYATGGSFTTNKIYLDVTAPEYDELAPTISVVATANSSANGPNGQPLFKTDVPITVTVTDPYASSSSSGLASITWAIYINSSTTATATGDLNNLIKDASVSSPSYDDAQELTYTISDTLTFDSATYNYNDLKLVVIATDNAGNSIESSYAFGIDVTSPTVSVTFDNDSPQNSYYFNATRTAKVVVTERNFSSSDFSISTSGSVGSWSYSVGSKDNGDDDTWTAYITYSVDGEYTLSISGKDLVGNSASVSYSGVATDYFVIDQTAPVVTVSYNTSAASNGMYYNVDRIATITVDEVNFDGQTDIAVSASAGGVAPAVAFSGNTSVLSFTADGNYSFSGTVTDLAGNVSATVSEAAFVIDQTLPEISISGVEDLSANSDPLDIILSMTDTNLNLSSITATLKGTNNGEIDISGNAAYISGGVEYVLDTIETDDYYLLTFVGTDLAGNSVSKSVSFSENQNGTVFEFVQEEVRNTYSNQSFAPSFILHNVDEVTVLSLTLNGEEVAYDYLDNTVTFREALTADGMYKITMDTVDAAGNKNTMDAVEFYLDFTVPALAVDGAEDGAYYFDAFTITLRKDNAADTYVLLQLNGKDLTEDDYILNEDGSITISIEEYQSYQLMVQLEDAAGNLSNVTDISFMLTNNIFIRWYANKVLFYGSLVLATVLIAMSFVLVAKRRNKQEEEETV